MARPTKVGLDYFPLDCHMEEKIRLIQAEFGLKGFAIVVKLYQKIYGELGYYCKWNEDSLLLFMSENGVSSRDEKNLIEEIVRACIRRHIFSETLFHKYGVLTSAGVQRRYLESVSRRESVELKKEYLLISVPKNAVNVVINSINVCNNSINVCNNTQSKVKKSKVKESILSAKPEALQSAYLDFIEMRKKIKKPLTDRALQLIIGKVEKLSSDTETQIAILNQSVEHCWQSVYELKDTAATKDKNHSYDINDFEKYTLQ